MRLLDDAAVLACLAYVDLNPIRAHVTTRLEGYEHVSISERLRTLERESKRCRHHMPVSESNSR